MNDREIDEILKRAAQSPSEVDPALLEKIAGAIRGSLRPVRPLPAAWAIAAGLVLISTAVAVAGAAKLGFHGAQAMSALERAAIFPAMGILLWLAATAWTAEMVPGSRRRIAPTALLGIATVVPIALFAVLFRDYRTERFVPQGVACLKAGLIFAVPAALGGWWLVRRGFAVNAAAAGLAAGIVSGLAGVGMLELHCANLETWHSIV